MFFFAFNISHMFLMVISVIYNGGNRVRFLPIEDKKRMESTFKLSITLVILSF